MLKRLLIAPLILATFPSPNLQAQSEVAAKPIVGLRDNRPRDYAFENAEVIVAPGHTISDATVLVEGTSITAVGTDVEIPPGFMVIDCTGKRIYAGLVDAWSETDVPKPESPPGYWNSNVTPQRTVASLDEAPSDAAKLRSQGITTRLVAPRGGIVKGVSAVVLLTDSTDGRRLLKEYAWQHLQLSVPRTGSRPRYPNSPMGATALLRQSLYDADWYGRAWTAYRGNPELPRPEENVALQALADAIGQRTFVIDAPNERMAVRAGNIAGEFSLKMILRGSGREYRQLDEIAATRRPILVPVDFPETPDVKTAYSAKRVTLQDLMHWDLAPENPARLSAAGLPICLTTDGLSNVGDYLKKVRVAVDRGLDADAALSAMTTVPAELLEIDDHVGRVRPGMLANLVITDGDLFEKKTKVLECWVAGEQFVISPDKKPEVAQVVGTWSLKLDSGGDQVELQLELTEKSDKLSGSLQASDPESRSDEAESEDAKDRSTRLKNLVRERDRLTATVDLHEVDDSLPQGVSLLTWVTVDGDSQQPSVFASVTLPDGSTVPLDVSSSTVDDVPSEEDESSDDETSEDDGEDGSEDASDDESTEDDSDDDDDSEESEETPTPVLYPFGALGLDARLTEHPTVLFRGATVWTCDERGVLESADVLVRDGLIVQVGQNLETPENGEVIDASGKHITPGLIDCHTHMGTDGGVNESGQAVTAEVRIGDFIDNSDIQIYRHSAGGVTTANILHGSANPIGGQNQVIKLRWGQSMDGLRMKEAPQGIKFALGENVKRNQSRYPNTRMGVEQIIRDQLLAAREYDAKWRRWRRGERDSLPPRTDLQLQALAEVQRGKRWIHCHSYRQDEILAMLDLLEEFGIQIGTLQHILEGYKVADRMARHGAMASAFSDWWAYKFEVFDGIPFNGALMHERGVVVSFNSDDRELARHLNTEAAKATKYGGVPEEEALKFVTLNPAKQLRIDQYVGSLTAGKHADLVVWSGRPLSTLSRCEQTWIDGRRYFDLESDLAARQRDRDLRARLIQKALGAGKPSSKQDADKEEVDEEDRWVRTDIYCATHGSARH